VKIKWIFSLKARKFAHAEGPDIDEDREPDFDTKWQEKILTEAGINTVEILE